MVAHLTEITKMTIYKDESSAGLNEEICSFHVVECLLPPVLLQNLLQEICPQEDLTIFLESQ